MRPTDENTRENIIKAKERGEKRETIALWLNVSVSTVDKVWRRFRETGSFLPIPYQGRKSKTTEAQNEQIKAAISEAPDITLEELVKKLSLPLTPSGLCFKLQRMGISRKRHTDQPYKHVYQEKHKD